MIKWSLPGHGIQKVIQRLLPLADYRRGQKPFFQPLPLRSKLQTSLMKKVINITKECIEII